MRVLIDTNVVISYLVQAPQQGSLTILFDAVFENICTLLLPEALLEEIYQTVSNGSEFAEHVPLEDLQDFLDALNVLGEELPLADWTFPQVSGDAKGDYFISYALLGKADYLITGDKKLLALEGIIDEFSIVTPEQFVETMEEMN